MCGLNAQAATAAVPSVPLIGPGPGAGAQIPGQFEELAVGPLATTNGTVIGPDYTQGTLASEAVGRQAVQLGAAGQYVQFRVAGFANAIDVDYALPQGASGTLSVYIDGVKQAQELSLTSEYSYISTPEIYGSLTHHFFNDARMLLGRQLFPGETVRLQVGASDTAVPYTINLIDFYEVAPPLPQPWHSVSVLNYGADPTGTADSTAAFEAASAAADAAHETVWVPPGQYQISTALQISSATIEGAGSWYSKILTDELINNTTAVPGR